MMLKNQRLRSGTKEVGTHLYTRLLILQEAYIVIQNKTKKSFKSEKVGIYWGAI